MAWSSLSRYCKFHGALRVNVDIYIVVQMIMCDNWNILVRHTMHRVSKYIFCSIHYDVFEVGNGDVQS